MKKLFFALLTLLLLGCQSSKDQNRPSRPEDNSLGRVIDSPALTGTPSQRGTDSIRKFYERLLALLLLGCQSPEDKATSLDCFVPRNDEGTASTDSLEKDSIRKFYERMELWNALHGGRSKWESDK